MPAHDCGGKTLDFFDLHTAPMVCNARIMAIAIGDSWLDNGDSILLIGLPGDQQPFGGSIGLGFRSEWPARAVHAHLGLRAEVQVARRELGLEAALARLDWPQLLIPDDITSFTKDRAETNHLVEQKNRAA